MKKLFAIISAFVTGGLAVIISQAPSVLATVSCSACGSGLGGNN